VIAVVGAVAVLVMQPAGIAGAGSTDSAPDDASARPPVLVVGHRGASADAPEHTGPAYDRAMWAGGDVLECDVQITADDQLVCIHDGSVDRTTGGSVTGPVDSFTLAELRSMDFGAWFGPEFAGARVVTLEEQITCYRSADPTMQFYVETKTQPEQGDRMESLLVELLGKLDAIPDGAPDVRTSPVIIQSFDADSLTTVRRLAPSLPTAFLFNAPTAEIEAGQFPDVEILAPNAVALADRPGFIDAAHSGGIEVHTWTVDDPAQMTRLVNAGVDGFFTNTPSTARTVVDQAGRGSGREPLDVDRATSGPSEVSACPTGMGVGLTPATQEVSAANDTDDATAPIGPTANDGFPIWPIVLGAVALVVVIGVLVAIRARRSGATDH
jgi:glycerophosphoryl diester phosphodiesterase